MLSACRAVVVSVAVLSVGAVLCQEPASARARDDVASVVQEAWEASGVTGITASVISSEGVLTSVASGFCDADRTEKMPADARMMAGSAGKTFVAAVMWRLIERGEATLEDPISRWLGDEPWFARLPNHASITLGALMSHTSGLMDHVREPAFAEAMAADPQREWTQPELLGFILDRDALFPAGERFSYADTNYTLVGLVIESITGEPFYSVAMRELIRPLGLTDSIPQTQAALPGLIEGVDKVGLFDMPSPVATDGVYAINPSWEWCGGGWVSTSPDLARWIRAYTDGTVLDASTVDAMRLGVEANTGPGDRYGPGLMILQTASGEAIGHLGFMPGYVTLALHFVDRNVSVAVQVNESSRSALLVLRSLAARLAALETAERPTP